MRHLPARLLTTLDLRGTRRYLPVKVLAARCALSPRHFTRQFREATGTTPHQWLLTRRAASALHGEALNDLGVSVQWL